MKKFLRYIYIFACLCILFSCERDEFNVSGNGEERTIEIIARTPGFNNVTVKADGPDFETAIYSAYLLTFDENGNRVGFYTLRDSKSPSGNLSSRISHKGTGMACIIANVEKTVVESLNTIRALNNVVLNLTYSEASEAAGCFGVPKLDGKPCFPMYGEAEIPENPSELEILLVRLFAKVTVKLDMKIAGSNITSTFTLYKYNLVNLPTKVRLINNNEESTWATGGEESFAQTKENDAINTILYNTNYSLEDINLTSIQEILGIQVSDLTEYYTFDIYVPEYCVLPIDGASDNQKNKPTNFDTSKNPIYLELIGEFTPLTGSTTNLQYDIYLGENATTSFTLNRNVHYTNYLTITGISNHTNGDEGYIDHRVSITPGNLINIFGEVANCYVIGSTGEYQLPAYKGAFKKDDMLPENMCSEGTHADLYIQSNSNVTIDSFTLEKDNKGAQVIGFNVAKMSGDCNAIIALYNGDEILWSWHLWFVSDPISNIVGGNANTGFFSISTQTMPDGAEMMDRNLGAEYVISDGLPSAAEGLFYQYGHKEPYIDSKYYGGGTSSSYEWGDDTKSPTDPCPPGYRIPKSTIWKDNGETNSHADFAIGNYEFTTFRYWDNGSSINLLDDVYYPYKGYIDELGNKVQSDSEIPDPTTVSEYLIPSKQEGLSYRDVVDLLSTKPLKFVNLKYTKYNINTHGFLIASDKVGEYSYTSKGTDIESCEIYIGEWENKGSLLRPNYYAKYKNNSETLTGEELKNKYETHYNTLIRELNGGWTGALTDLITPAKTEFKKSDINNNYGYQIRCVKE